MPRVPTAILTLMTLAAPVACSRPPSGSRPAPVAPGPWLVDVTEDAGVDFRHATGATGALHMPEIMGSGVALFDADGDGDLDLYFPNGNGLLPGGSGEEITNRYYRNDGDATFVDATAESGLGDGGYGMGAAVGDIDNDGDLDVYLTNDGPDRLFVNDGNGVFADATEAAGIDVGAWSCSAAFLDYDRDGFLDLYVTRYVKWTPREDCYDTAGRRDYCAPGSPYEVDVLLRNRGDGTFEDVSETAGIASIAAPGLGVACRDFTGDGWIDVYVANDAEANQLWVNRGDGTFTDEAVLRGVAFNLHGQPEAGMGVVAEDLDRDGDVDLYLTHTTIESNTFYRNEGRLGFQDATGAAGLAASSMVYTGFGTAALDLEHDGDLDIVVVNGRVQRADPRSDSDVPSPWDRYAEPNLLYLNDGAARFAPVEGIGGAFVSRVEVTRGLALGDIDDDGDLDVIVRNAEAPARVYRNDAPKKGHAVTIRVVEHGRDAVGATVTVVAGDQRWSAPIGGGSSYLSVNDLRAHVGLGAVDTIDAIDVTWNDGQRERFPGVEVDRFVEVVRGEGEDVE